MSTTLKIEGAADRVKHFRFLMIEDGREVADHSPTCIFVTLPDETEAQYVTEEANMKKLAVVK